MFRNKHAKSTAGPAKGSISDATRELIDSRETVVKRPQIAVTREVPLPPSGSELDTLMYKLDRAKDDVVVSGELRLDTNGLYVELEDGRQVDIVNLYIREYRIQRDAHRMYELGSMTPISLHGTNRVEMTIEFDQ